LHKAARESIALCLVAMDAGDGLDASF